MASGLTALRAANYAQQQKYYVAFFNITIGLERLMKLTLLLDGLSRDGVFPSRGEFKKKYGHNLRLLFQACQEVRARLPAGNLKWAITEPEIVDEMLAIWSDFAATTRYYNLDFLTGARVPPGDPLQEWSARVAPAILARKYSGKRAVEDDAASKQVEEALAASTLMRHTSASGDPMSTVAATYMTGRREEIVQKWATVYAAGLIRHLAETLTEVNIELLRDAQPSVPHLYEFFGIWNNSDVFFRDRRTFTV